ncbi:Putative uncharacterized protein, partial [Moritella viscosa]
MYRSNLSAFVYLSESALGTDEIPTTIPGDEELALELELE